MNPESAHPDEAAVSASGTSPDSPFKRGLKSKLIRMMILVGALPLFLATIISYVQGNKSLRSVIGSSFQALAFETATKIDLLMKERIQSDRRLAEHPTLVLSVNARNEVRARTGSPVAESDDSRIAEAWARGDEFVRSEITKNAASRILQSSVAREASGSASTHALFITDANGELVASTSSFPAYRQNGGAPESIEQSTYIGQLRRDGQTGEHVFEIAVPIASPHGKPIGVLHHVYKAKPFFASHVEPILFGQTGHVMLIDSQGVVLDCPILPTGTRLDDPALVHSVTGAEANWVETQSDGHGGRELSIIGFSPLRETNPLSGISGAPQWFTFAWQSSSEVFSPMRRLLYWIAGACLLSVMLIVILGSAASNRIVQPILLLQRVAAKIGRGEPVEPIQILTGDEIQILAEEINIMNELIRKSVSGLEELVRDKTREILYLKEYTEKVLMGLPDPILMFDPRLRIEYINHACEALTGTTSHSLIGRTLADAGLQPPEIWNRIEQNLARTATGEPADAEIENHRGEAPRDPLTPRADEPAKYNSQSAHQFGDRFYVQCFFQVMIRAREERRIGLLLKDITEEKKLLDQLGRAEKISGLGRLSSGIAHEINNPLFSVLGYTEAILEEKDPEKIRSFAGKVLARTKHISAIVQNLAGYVRHSKDHLTDVGINEKLDAAIEIAIMASLSDDIVVDRDYATLPALKARPEEIQQIFTNIITNAVQAMQGKGRLHIHTGTDASQRIAVVIRDNGPGIPAVHLSRIFDPFFTTKEQGQGTGLGLNIVHRLVEKYGGTIEVESAPGQGAAFTVRFPVHAPSGESTTISNNTEVPARQP